MAERMEQMALFGVLAGLEARNERAADAQAVVGAEAAAGEGAAAAGSPTDQAVADSEATAEETAAAAEVLVAEAPLEEPATSAEGGAAPSLPGQEEGFFGLRATRAGALAALAAEVRDCRRCRLREGCRGVVFGEGDPDSDVLFLGEGPGAVEDELGRPFVGPAGQLLDRILLAVGFRREQVYITNTVLCRPPGNRVPLPEEVAACRPWLRQRLAIMQPALIVCLGSSAAQGLLGQDVKITRDRGRWYELGPDLSPGAAPKVMPTFHPAALLRDPSKKRAVWADMKAVRAAWTALRQEPGQGS